MKVIFKLRAVKYVAHAIMNSENSTFFGLTVQIQILKYVFSIISKIALWSDILALARTGY